MVRLSHGEEAITNSIALTRDDTHTLLTIVHYIDKYRTPSNTHNPPVQLLFASVITIKGDGTASNYIVEFPMYRRIYTQNLV